MYFGKTKHNHVTRFRNHIYKYMNVTTEGLHLQSWLIDQLSSEIQSSGQMIHNVYIQATQRRINIAWQTKLWSSDIIFTRNQITN
jgi:hypothetical protein